MLGRIPCVVVDKVAETRGVYNGEAKTDAIFLNICGWVRKTGKQGRKTRTSTYAFDCDCFWPLCAWRHGLLWGVKSGVKKGVNEC